ncbi:helix-turn-helix DNA binding domain protein [Gordonia phage Pickett]|uniref:Helix-turn-helix DNA binding domain protein n=1 Tax=Gordonia phage Pickett TaxID=2910954 RepID=A0AAE8Z9V3_9CAUD|nr:helix-turn-helix DNA binding domain protein [Gordonia phage Pickett]UJD21091.1 helix-turn-helix DNA binding domain protein [Gordonia phage Pickett]
MSIRNGLLLSEGELYDLAAKLDTVGVISERLAILATDPMPRLGIAGPHVQSQPSSRPPYNIGAQGLLDELCTAIEKTVRLICEHRNTEPDRMGVAASAAWLKRNRIAIAMMPKAGAIHRGLIETIDRCARSAGLIEHENRISPAMVAEANRQVVTAVQVEKLGWKLGDQAKGLNKNRVDYLRRSGRLAGTRDPETGTWFYHLGDVLSAHKRAREARTHGKTHA